MSRLLHYSAHPIARVHSCRQGPGEPRYREDKPIGLWVSVEGEDDWRSWCESESFGDPTADICHEVVLAPDAPILRIASVEELDAFTDRYALPVVRSYESHGHGIKWGHVSLEYAGIIIIAPYRWERRLSRRTRWYCGWDCASGCIWDASAVASITALATHDTISGIHTRTTHDR